MEPPPLRSQSVRPEPIWKSGAKWARNRREKSTKIPFRETVSSIFSISYNTIKKYFALLAGKVKKKWEIGGEKVGKRLQIPWNKNNINVLCNNKIFPGKSFCLPAALCATKPEALHLTTIFSRLAINPKIQREMSAKKARNASR
jgi:hypothetical protein